MYFEDNFMHGITLQRKILWSFFQGLDETNLVTVNFNLPDYIEEVASPVGEFNFENVSKLRILNKFLKMFARRMLVWRRHLVKDNDRLISM